MFNPAYQNPDRRGRAGVTRGDRDDRGWKGSIKHTDIHLRIRTLIAEAGGRARELRAATETIEDEKVADPSPTVSVLLRRFPGATPYVGVTRSYECSRHKQSYVYVAFNLKLFDNQLLGSEYTEGPVPHGCTSCAE